MEVSSNVEFASISAIVYRADGTVEDLGVLTEYIKEKEE